MENQDTKILWSFSIRAGQVIKAGRAVIVLIDKKNQETFIINVAIPGNKEAEKISKYQDLAWEISQM